MKSKILSILMTYLFVFPAMSFAATFIVTNTLDDNNTGSLRWAIDQANANPDFDTIEFHIPSANPNDPFQKQIIPLLQPLPDITSPVLIDGWSQLGAQSVNIELKGMNKLNLYTSDSEIRGIAFGSLVIGYLRNNNNIHHNYVGVGLDGETSIANNSSNLIYVYEGQNNIISDNYVVGYSASSTISVYGAENTVIKGNVIGLTISGQKMGGTYGIQVEAEEVVIGGSAAEDRNVISGAQFGGISLVHSRNIVIRNNYIGLGIDGIASNTDALIGITVGYWSGEENKNVLIQENVIAGNVHRQIYISHNNENIHIKKNIIGLNVNGDFVGGQDQAVGIEVQPSQSVTIGGEPSDRNVIGGFKTIGFSGVLVFCAADIRNNYIGVGPDGVSDRGNMIGISYSTGWYCSEGVLNIANNIISNIGLGISDDLLSGHIPTVINDNKILKNRVGMQFVGGNAKVSNNLIKYNTEFGIFLYSNEYSGFATNVEIVNNSIYDNGSLGIELWSGVPGGVTPNDTGDTDEGVNHLLNYPILESVVLNDKFIAITLKLDIDASSALVQFFANTVADPSGHGEGEIYIGEATVPNSPDQSYTVVLPIPKGIDPSQIQNISSTATAFFNSDSADNTNMADLGSFGNTSEFSNVIQVVKGDVPVDFGDAPDYGPGTGSLNYQTTVNDNGPYHLFDNTFYMGLCVDGDTGGLENVAADADDKAGSKLGYGKCVGHTDDEDGVIFPSSGFVSGEMAVIKVLISSYPHYQGGYLNVWVDYNKDGDLSDEGERVATNQIVKHGLNALNVNIPRSVVGTTYLRARLTRAPLDVFSDVSVGPAQTGEVEDYRINILTSQIIGEGGETTKWNALGK